MSTVYITWLLGYLVPEIILYPREYSAVNVGGTVSLMEAMRDVGVRRVVLISSGAELLWRPASPTAHRSNSPPNPRSPYAVSKLSAEYYVRTIGDLWGIETVALRVFNAYGQGQHLPPSHPPVIPFMLKQAMRAGTIIVHGDGTQTRDYVYVDDVITAMVAASTAPDLNNQVINVGSGTEVCVRDLASLVIQVTGGRAEIVFNPRTDPGVSRMCADLSLAKSKLSYQPRFSLAEGLNRPSIETHVSAKTLPDPLQPPPSKS